MQIRRANREDVDAITQLFYDTINTVNVKDYTRVQIAGWSAGCSNKERWKEKIGSQYFYVAEEGELIIGFASLTADGYLDYMFVHKNLQGKGIAGRLLTHLELLAQTLHLKKIKADVSITAKAFFERKGFEIVEVHTKNLGDIQFENTIMEKHISPA